MQNPPTATLHPGKVVRILVVVAVLLLLANLVGLWMLYVLGYADVYGLAQLFDFDTEQNVPTYYSGCLFLLNGLLLLSVRQAAKILSKPSVIWLMLAALFLFLGSMSYLPSTSDSAGRLERHGIYLESFSSPGCYLMALRYCC